MTEDTNPELRRLSTRDRTAARLAEVARAQLLEGKAMTVASVGKRGGVSRATAYRYFSNSDALKLRAVLPLFTDSDAGETDGDDAKGAGKGLTPAARAELLARRRAAWAFEHEVEMKAILSASLGSDSEGKDVFRQATWRRRRWIEEALLPHLPSDVAPDARERLALALTHLMGSHMVVWTRDAAGLDTAQAIDLITWTARSLVDATLAESRAARRRRPAPASVEGRSRGTGTASRSGQRRRSVSGSGSAPK